MFLKRVKPANFIIISLLSSVIISCQFKKTNQEEEESPVHLYEYGICVDSLDINRYTIKSGDLLFKIITDLGFPANQSYDICQKIAPFLSSRQIRTGGEYSTLTTQDSLSTVKYIIFEKSMTEFAIVDLTADSINAYNFTKPVQLVRKYTEGEITSSLWNALVESGAGPLLALRLSDIYAWQIDFFDIKEGDSFSILYDVACIDDTTIVNIASVEGAIFTHQKKKYFAIPFSQDSIMEYFDEEGNSLRKAFLKAPLDFFRITSRFSNARFHPVLKRYRPHHGVDYAAPVGTPVKSIGDGVVIAKGFQRGGGGNFLKIKHNTTYTTVYMHLNRFAKGIEKGSSVKQGQVVAYVGSTGLSTGPHLDFRVFKNNRPINPLTMETPPSLPVKPELKDSFQVVKQRVLSELEYEKTKRIPAEVESHEVLNQ